MQWKNRKEKLAAPFFFLGGKTVELTIAANYWEWTMHDTWYPTHHHILPPYTYLVDFWESPDALPSTRTTLWPMHYTQDSDTLHTITFCLPTHHHILPPCTVHIRPTLKNCLMPFPRFCLLSAVGRNSQTRARSSKYYAERKYAADFWKIAWRPAHVLNSRA